MGWGCEPLLASAMRHQSISRGLQSSVLQVCIQAQEHESAHARGASTALHDARTNALARRSSRCHGLQSTWYTGFESQLHGLPSMLHPITTTAVIATARASILSTNACMFWLKPQQTGDMFASLLSVKLCVRQSKPPCHCSACCFARCEAAAWRSSMSSSLMRSCALPGALRSGHSPDSWCGRRQDLIIDTCEAPHVQKSVMSLLRLLLCALGCCGLALLHEQLPDAHLRLAGLPGLLSGAGHSVVGVPAQQQPLSAQAAVSEKSKLLFCTSTASAGMLFSTGSCI